MKEDKYEALRAKAEVLIVALPYIQRFNRRIIVVKYGGSAMLDDQLKMNVIKDVALLKLVGMRPIIVHGGGKEISKWVKLSGKEPEFYNGLRVTDKETMNIAEMVLNKVNKELVGLMQKMGVNAVGLCGKDGNMIRVNKKMPDGKDIGFVGEVASVNIDLLNTLMDNDFIPVIAPIGLDAIEQGVSRVHILDGRVAHCLLLEFFTEKGIGTAILKEPLF